MVETESRAGHRPRGENLLPINLGRGVDPVLGPHNGRAMGHEWEWCLQPSAASGKLGLNPAAETSPRALRSLLLPLPSNIPGMLSPQDLCMAVSPAWCALSRASLTPSGHLCGPNPLPGSPPSDIL